MGAAGHTLVGLVTADSAPVIRAVVDTSALVSPRLRRALQQQAQLGAFEAVWSAWIVAELNRVLVWRWLERTGDETSSANERACATSAKRMMDYLIAVFAMVDPKPPYPPPWEGLADAWDHPIWAAAKASGAGYVVSENTRHYPPRGADGRHAHEGIIYMGGDAFLTLLDDGLE